MKIVCEFPPNYKLLAKNFKLHSGVIFTYGDTLYNPDGGDIPNHLEKHEETHKKQQGDKIEEWWNKYIDDKDFRLSQELEAYQRQYRVAKNEMSRNELFNLLRKIATDLSSELYGDLISFNEAMNLIKKINL